MKLRFYLWLFSFLAMLGYMGVRFYTSPSLIETNVLALLPTDQRHLAGEIAVNKLVEATGQRIVMLIGHKEAATARATALHAASLLRQSQAFSEVQAEVGNVDIMSLLSTYKQYRFGMLTGEDRQALQGDASQWLNQHLMQRLMFPVQGSIGLSIEEDPFGFFNRVLMGLPLAKQTLYADQGWLTVQGKDGITWIMLSGKIRGSPYVTAVQNQVEGVLDRVFSHAHKNQAHVISTGALLFANEARKQAEAEMNLIGTISALGVLVVMVGVFRTLRHIVLASLALIYGMVAATAITLLFFENLNLLTLVMGSSLIGVAIDYPIQLFAYQMEEGANWRVKESMRKVRTGLILGLLTTLLGFGVLGVLPFPGLQQIAVFSCVGLVAALLTVFECYPLFLSKPMPDTHAYLLDFCARILKGYQRFLMGYRGFIWMAVALLLTLPGVWQLKANDDIRQLIQPSARLQREEAQIRELLGQGNNRQFFLVEGANEAQVLQRSQAMLKKLNVLKEKGELAGYQSVASFVPLAQDQLKDRQLVHEKLLHSGVAEQQLRQMGMREEVINKYLSQLNESQGRVLTVNEWLTMPVSLPFRHLWLGRVNGQLVTAIIPINFKSLTVLEQAAQGMEGISWIDKAGSVSRLFAEFRVQGTKIFWVALLLTFGVLAWHYRVRVACVMTGLILAVIVMTLGVLGWLNIELNLFIALAFMLVLGVGIDYFIFLHDSNGCDKGALLGVILSAITTLLAFGLMVLSSVPAVSNFGLTLLIGVTLSLLAAPMIKRWEKPVVASRVISKGP